MTLPTRQLLKDWHVAVPMLASLFCLMVQAYAVFKSIPASNDSFVIRASQGFGPTQIGAWWELFVPYLIVVWFALLNTCFAFVLYERYKLVSRFIAWFSLSLSLLLIIYTHHQITTPLAL